MNTLRELLISWPERAALPIRLHLYNSDRSKRCDWRKLRRVFDCAKKFNVSATISTNTNRLNAVYVMLDNYVLVHDLDGVAYRDWGYEYRFLLALAKMFPGDVFVDPPENIGAGERYVIDSNGDIVEVIRTEDQ